MEYTQWYIPQSYSQSLARPHESYHPYVNPLKVDIQFLIQVKGIMGIAWQLFSARIKKADCTSEIIKYLKRKIYAPYPPSLRSYGVYILSISEENDPYITALHYILIIIKPFYDCTLPRRRCSSCGHCFLCCSIEQAIDHACNSLSGKW